MDVQIRISRGLAVSSAYHRTRHPLLPEALHSVDMSSASVLCLESLLSKHPYARSVGSSGIEVPIVVAVTFVSYRLFGDELPSTALHAGAVHNPVRPALTNSTRTEAITWLTKSVITCLQGDPKCQGRKSYQVPHSKTTPTPTSIPTLVLTLAERKR